MPATNRYMNYGTFSFGGTAITGIQSFEYDPGVSTKMEGADADPGPTVRVVDFLNPTFSFSTLDANAAASQVGNKGIFIATLLDAYNKATASGGGKTYTTNNLSVLTNGQVSSRYREFASRAFRVETTWADPATPPVSIASL